MPTIREKTLFNYNGEWSSDYNVSNINIGSGMFEEILLADRSIDEVSIKGNDRPLYKGIENSPIEFDMVIAFNKKYTEREMENVINWLFQNTYKPLFFKGKENRVFYCMPTGSSTITHNGMNEGYLSIRMRCNSSYIYSPTILTKKYDLSMINIETIELENDGYGFSYPEISIEKVGSGDITLINKTVNGYSLKISNLANAEKIYIDCEKEMIETNLIGVYRYNDTVGIFPYLQHGRNVIEVNGNCKIQFRYKSKYRF